MGYEKKFALKILESEGIYPSKITKADASGQKKVFYITVNNENYVLKLIDITPLEIDEEDLSNEYFEELKEEKKLVNNEKIIRLKKELQMAKNVPILPQLKLIDNYKEYNDDGEIIIYYIEERYEGDPLSKCYKKDKFSFDETIDFIKQLVKLVKIMYESRYIHRDIKPSNIIVNNKIYKLIDGGLCKYIDDKTNLTRLNSFIGTARYAAPEQEKRNEESTWDFTTDLYPIGLIAMELYLKDAREYSDEHLKDLEYMYEKWKSDDKKTNLLFSKVIARLSSKNKAKRFNDFDEIFNEIDKIEKIGSDC